MDFKRHLESDLDRMNDFGKTRINSDSVADTSAMDAGERQDTCRTPAELASQPTALSKSTERSAGRQLRSRRRVSVFGIVLLGGWLLVLFVVLQMATIIRNNHGFSFTGPPSANGLPAGWTDLRGHWFWLTLTAVLLLWSVVNLHWALGGLRRCRRFDGFFHLALVLCCGLMSIGVELLTVAMTVNERPLVLDYSNRNSSKGSAVAVQPEIEGDAEAGRKLFAVSCVVCHGPTGGGLNNLAPSLRDSEFVKAGDQLAIRRVIAYGRSLTDPANTSGRVMPAKGGNPFLNEQQIADLAAFVAGLPADPSNAANGKSPSTEAAGRAETGRPGRVGPGATGPGSPPDLSPSSASQTEDDRESSSDDSRGRGARLVRQLGFVALGLHVALVLSLIGVTARPLFNGLCGAPLRGLRSWSGLVAGGWWVALLTWGVIIFIFER